MTGDDGGAVHPEDLPSVLLFDLEPERAAAITAELMRVGIRVRVITSEDASLRWSMLELVEHDLIVLQAHDEGICASRRIVDHLMGPQGRPVVSVVLLVDPTHSMPFSAAVDLETVAVPFAPAQLRERVEDRLQGLMGQGSKRRVQQMATRSLSVTAVDPMEPPASPRTSPLRQRWVPWMGAAVAATVVFMGTALVTAGGQTEPAPVPAVTPTVEVGTPWSAPGTAAVPSFQRGCPPGMVLVEGGVFSMGTRDDSPVLAMSRPVHRAAVGSFCIDRTEVTVEAYQECSDVGECERAHRRSWWPRGSQDPVAWERARELHGEQCNERYDDRAQHPINCVSWAQAERYCQWRGASLPTEAQWERAARSSDGRRYPWGNEAPDSERINGCGSECVAWRKHVGLSPTGTLYRDDDGFAGTAPVGSFPRGRSAAGLEDVAGNVFEWTADGFAPYAGGPVDPAGPDEGDRRVIRGGAFNSFRPEFADPALRFAQDAQAHTDTIGFRCATVPQ